MSSGLKTRNPLILFESNSNSNVPSRQVARNPITQGDTNVQPIQYSKKAVERNPILQADSHPVVRTSQSFINKTVSRNPIIADPNEHLVKGRNIY